MYTSLPLVPILIQMIAVLPSLFVSDLSHLCLGLSNCLCVSFHYEGVTADSEMQNNGHGCLDFDRI